MLISDPKTEIIQHYVGGPNVIISILKNKERDIRGGQHDAPCRGLDLPLLALKTEEAASQGMWAVSRSWKKQENRSSPGALRKECSLVGTLILAQ